VLPDEHLFRREAGRMVSALTRMLGVRNLALAEDAVQDAFCRAMEVWKFGGLPDNPSAWLMATARNRALDLLRRERGEHALAPELGRLREVRAAQDGDPEEPLEDDQLRMMFSCCHPRLPEEAQIALVLQILCGFGVAEIAAAFLDSPAAVEKRLVRAKKVLAGSTRLFDLAQPAELRERLPAVQRALYLLFNEGYHGACSESAVRVELTDEALRLARLLLVHPQAGTPAAHALAALMCLHAARMPGRYDSAGEPCPLFEQDRSRWNARLLSEGLELLDRAATGDELSEYHLEAGIAAVHAAARRPEETRWAEIVPLYDALLGIRPSPVVALGRAIAIAELEGAERGLAELRAIEGRERLSAYPFYPAAFGEFELRAGRPAAAREHFRRARALARNPAERSFLEQRLLDCEGGLAADERGASSGR